MLSHCQSDAWMRQAISKSPQDLQFLLFAFTGLVNVANKLICDSLNLQSHTDNSALGVLHHWVSAKAKSTVRNTVKRTSANVTCFSARFWSSLPGSAFACFTAA